MFLKSGARKKKFLTDDIDFIPFPKQNLREKVAEKPKENVAAVRFELKKAPEQKIVQSPTGNSQVKTISIYRHTQVESQNVVNTENLPHEEYTIETVKVLWRQYALHLKEIGQSTFCAVLSNSEPIKLSADTFGIQVQTSIQANMIKDQLLDMTMHFRKSLKNYSFSFELVMDETTYTEHQFKNGHEKFRALVQKNPNLETFRRLFDLDIEY